MSMSVVLSLPTVTNGIAVLRCGVVIEAPVDATFPSDSASLNTR
jgi:hypothetical protein